MSICVTKERNFSITETRHREKFLCDVNLPGKIYIRNLHIRYDFDLYLFAVNHFHSYSDTVALHMDSNPLP